MRNCVKSISELELNRAFLARQHLLEPTDLSPFDLIESLLAVQAQEAEPPYTALWARSKDFSRKQLTDLFVDRSIVRASGFRQTIHVMSSRDYAAFYPIQHASIVKKLNGHLENHPDSSVWLQKTRDFLLTRESGFTGTELRSALSESVPGYPADKWRGASVRMGLATVRIPRKGPESDGPRDYWVSAENYLGRDLPLTGDVDELVRRYLKAYGPASMKDAQNFLGMTRLQEVFERLKSELVHFKTENGIIVFDLPDAPRPSGDTPAPVKMVAAYDHLILGHADRSRVIQEKYRLPVAKVNAVFSPVFTVNGKVAGMWKFAFSKDELASVHFTLFEHVDDDSMDALHREAQLYMEHRAPGASQNIVVDKWKFN